MTDLPERNWYLPKLHGWDAKGTGTSPAASSGVLRCCLFDDCSCSVTSAPLSGGGDSGPAGARWTLKKNISFVLTVPTATSSRAGLHARQDTWPGRFWHHATGRSEAVFHIATDLMNGGKPSGGESAGG